MRAKARCFAKQDNYKSMTHCYAKKEVDLLLESLQNDVKSFRTTSNADTDVYDYACYLEHGSAWDHISTQTGHAGIFMAHPFHHSHKEELNKGGEGYYDCSGYYGGESIRSVCTLNVYGRRPPSSPDRLLGGARLLPGQSLYSATGGYRLLLHGNGRLSLLDHFDVCVDFLEFALTSSTEPSISLVVDKTCTLKNRSVTLFSAGEGGEGSFLQVLDTGQVAYFKRDGTTVVKEIFTVPDRSIK